MKKFLFLAALIIATPALAQNAISGSPRVQGVPDGFGDPVQVTITGPNGADVTGTTAPQVQGNVASGAADSGNPVKAGGRVNTSSPVFTDGQRADLQIYTRGRLLAGTGGVITGQDALNNAGLFAWAADDDAATAARAAIVANLGFNGATWDRIRSDTNLLSVGKGLSATRWRYTSGTSPILSNTTTAVTIKTAGGAGVRNAIDSCQLTTTAFGASVPLAIRDGAGGTVVWALTVPTAGFLQPVTIVFEQPLVGTANTLTEVVTTTANTSGTVTLSCQGHTEV